MNAAYETFSEHSGTSTHDIAFLTVSDISNQLGISKSKLYKDIREGKLLAEKSLDETLVVSPKALQQAYRTMDLSALIDAELPAPNFLDDADSPEDEKSLVDIVPEEEVSGSFEQTKSCAKDAPIESTELTPGYLEESFSEARSQTEERDRKTHSGAQIMRIIGFSSVAVICSAILVSVFANI